MQLDADWPCEAGRFVGAACGQVRDPKVAVTERVWMLAGATPQSPSLGGGGGADRSVGAVRHDQPLRSGSDRQPEVADWLFGPVRVWQRRAP
jgi:hypothetical protein